MGNMELRLLGELGDRVVAGLTVVELIGTPQTIEVTTRDCEKLIVLASQSPDHVAPFAQLRPAYPVPDHASQPKVAGLGFDGGTDGDVAIVNLWYRNPHRLPITSGTEFRLYRAGPAGVVPVEIDPRESVWWWSGPLTLAVDTQMARIEFNPQRLTINGDTGVRSSDIVPGGSYLLTLNVSRFSPETASLWVQQIIPLVRIDVHDAGISTEVFSGITSVESRGGAAIDLVFDRHDADWHIDFTP